jgi:hypothetical protein
MSGELFVIKRKCVTPAVTVFLNGQASPIFAERPQFHEE